MIDPMIPGSAAAALPASLPRSLPRALSLFLVHSPTLLGFLGGVGEPPVAALPVSAETNVEIIKPSDVSTAVMVNPCSLRMSLSFSRKLMIAVENFLNCLRDPAKIGKRAPCGSD